MHNPTLLVLSVKAFKTLLRDECDDQATRTHGCGPPGVENVQPAMVNVSDDRTSLAPTADTRVLDVTAET
jgi:hypothetical protein